MNAVESECDPAIGTLLVGYPVRHRVPPSYSFETGTTVATTNPWLDIFGAIFCFNWLGTDDHLVAYTKRTESEPLLDCGPQWVRSSTEPADPWWLGNIVSLVSKN
eukprot:TRINITY_DN67543_c1_g3_i2.p1 TRINITY_DN67543_c1_g3~~TRINITY_DN67543_c1_g3_i2.p1  ORF type:complete len:105 (+),score=2.02 TRINITY_DN67543_c1_g3_i2:317-631(+)